MNAYKRLWFCCNRSIRTKYCPLCGAEQPDFSKLEPAIPPNSVLQQAEILRSEFEGLQMKAHNTGQTWQSKIPELELKLSESKTDSERREIKDQIWWAQRNVAGRELKVLHWGGRRKIMEALMDFYATNKKP
jgi:hypothetical protein